MRYRIQGTPKGLRVTVEDGEGNVVGSAPAADMAEAVQLRDRAVKEGPGFMKPDPLDHDGDGRKGGSRPKLKVKGAK